MNNDECEEPLSRFELDTIAKQAAAFPKGGTSSRRKKDESLLRYFKFNIAEWLTDDDIAVMTDAQRGRYINLLAACWPKGGTLPSDPNVLHRLARATCSLKVFIKELAAVIAPFEVQGDLLVHSKLAAEFAESNKNYQQKIEAGLESWKKKKKEREANSKPPAEILVENAA